MAKKKGKSQPMIGTCLECGTWVEHLPTHLKYSHGGMPLDEYMAKHGRSVGSSGPGKAKRAAK